MKILIFGGTGFVGKTLAIYLRNFNHEVYTCSRSTMKEDSNHFQVDISDAQDFEKINLVPDIVINSASQVPQKKISSKDPSFVTALFQTNVTGALNIASWSVKKKVSKIINLSTLVTVAKPWPKGMDETYQQLPEGYHVAYAMSKLSQERIMTEVVKDSTTTCLHFRLSAVYGVGMNPEGIIFTLADKLRNNETVTLSDGDKVSFDFINVKDIAEIIKQILPLALTSGVYNLGSSEEITLRKLNAIILKLLNSKSEVIFKVSEQPESFADVNTDKLFSHLEIDKEVILTPFQVGLEELLKTTNHL